ncbi:hypothetical protein QE382_002134 [Sphingobacterium zeae]|uniref:Uncharacterized protein n=1 Tax=Sphingobacterium zeae TaxID=1776859 RepID=A0ABU0U5B0_9SPHI|nr:hypothetical protein [Sphingobacterium zeae]MDQ1150150.1 hypothetical protein [Sphingobacterium zeae]
MKKTTSIILIAAFIISLVAIVILSRNWIKSEKEYSTLKNSYEQALLSGKGAPLHIRDTIYDTVAGTVTYMYNPIQTEKPVTNYVSKGLADTLARALGVATEKIDRLQSELVSIKGKGKGERYIDTITKTKWLAMKDPVFDVKINLENDSIYTGATIALDRAYAPYKKNIFSRYEYRSVIRARDPRVTISNLYDVNKVPKSPRWGISFIGGPVVTPKGLSYGVGLGLTYDIISF